MIEAMALVPTFSKLRVRQSPTHSHQQNLAHAGINHRCQAVSGSCWDSNKISITFWGKPLWGLQATYQGTTLREDCGSAHLWMLSGNIDEPCAET